jgi:tetratricopeptide (TPR) repeat protein
MGRVLASILLLLVSSSCIVGQMAKENCALSVHVRTLDERNIETPVQVEVLSPQGVVATASIAGDQAAEFQVTSGKNFRLKVTGSNIESVTTSFIVIQSLENTHSEIIHVKVLNQDEGQTTPAGSATVSMSEMGAPKKAVGEMKKGLDAYSHAEITQAQAHFEKAVAEYPRYALAYDMLGVIAVREPDRPKARELFSRSIQTDSTFFPAYVDLARLDLQDKQYAESESLLGKAISLNPSAPDAVALLAATEFANKEYDKALVDVDRTHALRNHEQFAEVHLMAARVLRMQNRPNEAIIQFQLFLKEKPNSPEGESARRALASLGSAPQP